MVIKEFALEGNEYIELSQLLKVCDLVNSGGEAKVFIKSGAVLLNGEAELRKRKKIFEGDVVQMNDNTIRIIA